MDSAGNLYIADGGNYVIRKVSNGLITTVAGNGTFGSSGDSGPATSAQLGSTASVAVDSAGNLYIADAQNNRIRQVSNGVITTVAGNGTFGFSGDNGPATGAQLSNPQTVAVDSAGNLYIADSGNARIREVSKGVINTVAGNGTYGFSGDNGPATGAQISPGGVAVDAVGNLYIADTVNQRIREVSNGVITTVAGNGTMGFSGDNGPATSASLSSPQGMAVDSTGNVYLTEPNTDNRVRVLTPPFTSANSASYAPAALAPDMIAFGAAAGIAPNLIVASDGAWPINLGGVSLEITDSTGQTLHAAIYYVTTNAIAYLIPAGTAPGPATLKLTTSTGAVVTATLEIAQTSPALYTANATGSGVPAGLWIRVPASGPQTHDYLFDPNQPLGSRVPVPVDLGAATDQVFLSLYGTGFRGASNASATVGGVSVPVYGFAATGTYQGEDVVNVGPLPRSLAGAGVVNVVVTFDKKSANIVTVSIR